MLKNKNNKQLTLIFFLFSLGMILTFIVLDVLFFSYNTNKKLVQNGLIKIEEKELFLKNVINNHIDILKGIRKSQHFNNYLKNPNTHKESMDDIFSLLVQQNPNIMQLRYINAEGFEKIRVDRLNLRTEPIIISDINLQNKATRYYFKDSITKPLEKVWFSNLDLNIERGKVEIPYKPTLRAMLPLKVNDSFGGILIINYHMKNILSQLQHISLYDLMLIDENGYALIHYEKTKDWSFYKNKKETVQNEFKRKEYQDILSKDSVHTNTFISKRLEFNLPTELILVLKVKASYLQEYKKDKSLHYFLVGGLILILSALMSYVFSSRLKKLFLIVHNTNELNMILNDKIDQKTLELEKKQKQYKDIVDTLSDFIWEVNSEGVYTYVSPQIKDILGFTQEEVIGKTPFDLMPPKTRKRIKSLFLKTIEKQENFVQLKNKNIHKNGSEVYLETSGNPVYENGRIVGYRGIDRDITEKVLIEKEIAKKHLQIQELNRNLEKRVQEEVQKNQNKDAQLFAQSKMAAMGDMIGNIAHQWRQPLSTISTTASGVKVKYEFEQLNEHEIPELMDKIVNQTQYLSNTIDTFRNFLKEKKEFKRVQLVDTIQTALNLVNSSLINNHIQLEDNFDEYSTLELDTIPTELQEVIINIMNNARDAITSNEIKNGFIKINLSKDDEQVYITIIDNGGGIPDDIIGRIFEPYFTTKYESQGTGLGLHMAYRVIKESLGGNIIVSNENGGAKFEISLLINSVE